MNLKAVIQKVVSWFKGEVKAFDHKAQTIVSHIENNAKTDASEVMAYLAKQIVSTNLAADLTGALMNTPAVVTAAIATPASNVNTAVQIALALKAIDALQSVEAIQAATNAALAALYPVTA